jgi:hypothetical protein
MPEAWLAELAPRMPKVGWEGWFLITIGAPNDPIRWTKTHIFRCSGRRGRYPLAAVEGLEAQGEIVTFVGTRSGVLRFERAFERGELDAGASLAIDGACEWQLGEPMRFLRTQDAHRIELEIERPSASDRIAWIRLPRVIEYVTRFANAKGSVVLDGGPAIEHSGLALFEHAYGAEVHFSPRKRLVRGPWHWDILALPQGAAGALAVSVPGLGMIGLRAAGKIGDRFRGLSRPQIKRDHVDVGWRGLMRDPGGPSLHYSAVASTPVVTAAPGVFFVGFDYTGELRDRSGSTQSISGSGFAEFGQPE